jgi:CRP/FNR family transcriptional regulator, cyclic AMP receptor protein
MRIPREVLGMLEARPLFSGLSQKELRSIAALGTTLDVEAGSVLTKESDVGKEAFLILTGTARCSVGDVQVAVLGPGELFGEMSLLDGAPRSATVVAQQDMRVTNFDRGEFVRLVEVSPKIALKLLAAMATRLRAVDQGFVANYG